MITAVIATLNDERRLGLTLAALVPAAVDGLVRQLIVADGGSSDATLEIADDAGAVMVGAGLEAACAAAGQPWVLVLSPGARLAPGWEPMAHAHMQASPARVGRIEPVASGGMAGWVSRLGRGAPAVGLLAPKAMLAGAGATLDAAAAALKRRSARLDIGVTLEA